MTKENRGQTELHTCKDGKHQERQAGDDTGKNQRKNHEAAKKRFAGKTGSVQGESGEQTERQ